MSRLKIEHRGGRIKRAKLRIYIDHVIAEDTKLKIEWASGEQHQVVASPRREIADCLGPQSCANNIGVATL